MSEDPRRPPAEHPARQAPVAAIGQPAPVHQGMTLPPKSSPHSTTFQHSHPSSSQASTSAGSSRPSAPSIPGGIPYDDPTNILQVYPFITHQPTARVATHFSSHTVVDPTPTSSSSIYPQYAEAFQRVDRPQTAEDWAMRNALEARTREMLNANSSYYNQYTPVTDSSTFTAPPDLRPYPSDNAPVMPYTFLPSYMPQASHQPPTPTSATGPTSPSGMEFFNGFVADTLERYDRPVTPEQATPTPKHSTLPPQTASAQSTPSLARAMARTALTPESSPGHGPSPTKKQKVNPTPSSSRSTTAPSAPSTKITIKAGFQSQPLAGSSASTLTPLSSPAPATPKKKHVVVVEIPSRKSFPNTRDDVEESEEDDLGWEEDTKDGDGDWDMDNDGFKGGSSPDPLGLMATPGSGRTGDRDMRSHFTKLQNLFDDIFEESDTFPAEPTDEHLSSSRYFSAVQQGTDLPLLADRVIEKISRHIARIQKGERRQSTDSVEWDSEVIGRILRLLERGLAGVEGIDPFPSDTQAAQRKKTKSKTRKEKDETGSPDLEDALEGSQEITEFEVEEGQTRLTTLKRAVLAAECVLAILDTEGLSKQLLSEDLLTQAVSVVKEQISKVLIPVLQALTAERVSSKYLKHVVSAESPKLHKAKRCQPTFTSPLLSSIAQSCSASLPRITSLLGRLDISFSDQLVIQTVYMTLAPLFVSEPAVKRKGKDGSRPGTGVLRALRVEALGCLRGIFARYEDQRQWIVEEIMTSMGRSFDVNSSNARFQLANGTSIHTISALLLQLVQASVFGLTSRVRKLRVSAREAAANSEKPAEKEAIIEKQTEEEYQICNELLESALKSARVVVSYLIQRSGASKTSKSSHDADYKAIFEMFVEDLLAVLYRPEWPAASLYLSVMSRILITALEDKSSESHTKLLAADTLAAVGAKLRAVHVEAAGTETETTPSLDEIISSVKIEDCAALSQKHNQIRTYLSAAAREDGMYGCSLDMSTLTWGQELHAAIKKSASVSDKLAQEKDAEAQATRSQLQTITQTLRSILYTVWMGDDSLFEVSDPNALALAQNACMAVSRGRPLQNAFVPILNALINAMSSTAITLRNKGLRGLGLIVTADPDVLAQPSVKDAIDGRLSDASASVRDAAVELIGKYVVQKPSLALEYYPYLAQRVTDSGLAVRKRVIKLLRSVFSTTDNRDIKVDICCKMITLMADTDEGIKDLAIKTTTELLYSASADHLEQAGLIVDVLADYQGGSNLLEIAISEVAKQCEKAGQSHRLSQTVAALFERLEDTTERSDIDPLSHIKAIYLLVTAKTDLIDVGKAEVLLSYLKRRPANPDEILLNDAILRTFKRSIPTMPRVASSFATKLSEELMPMISQPVGGLAALKETVGCFCIVANHLTRDYSLIMRVLMSCEAKIRQMRNEWNTQGRSDAAAMPASPLFLYICASIAEHSNLDELAETDDSVRAGLQKICAARPFYEYLFEALLDFTKMPIPQASPSMCLGSLFRAYPVLILRPEAMDWMDAVFASNDTPTQAKLLTVIHDFLLSEADKKAGSGVVQKTKGKNKDMEALIGSAAELSESGLSTAVVQRNINHILDGAKSQHVHVQSAALDILAFTVNQGLYHPLQCLPILVSLETSENELVADQAMDLHRTLHAKHSTLVNVRFLDFAKASYEYQRSITAEVTGHRDGYPLLGGWYSLVSEKRTWKHDFLKQLCRVFDYDLSSQMVPDVGLALYICDNLATLEYKLQEEVMTVVGLMSSAVGQCTNLLMVLEGGTINGEGSEMIEGKEIAGSQVGETYRASVVIHASIVVGLAMMAKSHLLDLYSIPEDKCIKHVPGKKSSMGDKLCVKRREGVLDTSRMSLVRGVLTVDDFKAQRDTFLAMAHEDEAIDDA